MATFVDKLEVTKTAVLFIEYQNEFCTEGGKMYPAVKSVLDATNMLHNSKQLIEVARAKGIKVLHAPITFSDDFRELATENLFGILANIKAGNAFLASDWGGKIIDSMAPVGHDIVVQGKRGLCAFASTNLDFILRQNGIETLILCGFLTNCCVESTMRTAYEKGMFTSHSISW